MKKILLVISALILLGTVFVFFPKQESEEQAHFGDLPIIYHHDYNLSLWGIENFHPFDSKKYKKVFNKLEKEFSITYDDVSHPVEVGPEILLLVHSSKYLLSLKESETIEKIVEIPGISWIPASMLDKKLLYPMRLATGGTLMAVDAAQKFGWAINLSGGYHHAKKDEGDGFCAYGDIALAADKYLRKNVKGTVLIVDLDAHQGNGPESMLGNDPRIAILDIYNEDIYPHDEEAKKYIRYHGPIYSNMEDDEYLALTKNLLDKAFKENKFDLVIYNAGTDIYEADSLGEIKISAKGIIKRDEIVFKEARKRKIPIMMLLSGGYTQESGNIIGDSIINLEKKGLIDLKVDR